MAAKNYRKPQNSINPDYFCLLTPFMGKANYVILGFMIILTACTERLVCPAYQSAYIYDKNELRKKFSYFQEDSTPKIFTASKTKYLIAEPTPYRKKLRSLQTVPMKKVFVNVPDSISGNNQDSVITSDLDKAARSVIDSTTLGSAPARDTVKTEEDSTYVITKDKEVRVLKYNMPDSLEYDAVNNRYVAQKPKYYIDEVGYNMEQDNYMWYLRRSLVLPDVRIAKMQQSGSKESGKEGAAKKEKKGILGFFKNLFGKKNKQDIDSAELEIPKPENEEFDFIDTTATMGPVPAEKTSRKKNVISEDTDETKDEGVTETPADKPSRKKKKKTDTAEPVPNNTEPKKEENDGF
jgi:hypothetical protein